MLHIFRDKSRSKAIWIVTVVGTILSFVIGFNLAGNNSGQVSEGSAIGTVAGKDLSYHEFQALLNNRVAQYRQQSGREPDDNTQAQISSQTWQEAIQRRVLTARAHQMGLAASDQEVVFSIRNPSQDILSPELIQGLQGITQLWTNGQFDATKYRQMLEDPRMEQQTAVFEQNQRDWLPMYKLLSSFRLQAKVTDAEVRDNFHRSADKVTVQLVTFPVLDNTVDPAKLARKDVEAWFEKHKSEFVRPAEAKLLVVGLPKRPNTADEATARDNAVTLHKEALADTNFAVFANRESDVPVARDAQGNYGTEIQKSQLPAQAADKVFALPLKGITEPIFISGGWHILQYHSPGSSPDRRRIVDLVVAVKAGTDNLTRLRDQLRLVHDAAEKKGLAAAATEQKLQSETTNWFSENFAPPQLVQQLPEAVGFALHAKKGALSQLLEKPTGIFILQVAEKLPAGQRRLEDVEGEVRMRVAQEQMLDQSEAKARPFLAQAQQAGIEAAARASGRALLTPAAFSRSGPFPPELQGENELIGTSFGAADQQVRLVRGERAVFLMRVFQRQLGDPAQLAAGLAQQRSSLLQAKQQEVAGNCYKVLLKEARVKDRRADYGI